MLRSNICSIVRMAETSNQNLWQILIGHSALRDPGPIRAVLSSCMDRLLNGLAYYKEPSPDSEEKVKSSDEVKGKKRTFVLEISKHLHLDQLLSIELFQCFLRDAYRGSLGELNSKLVSDLECQKLLHQLQEYYRSERLYGLRCLKHLLGYWQDPSHPYREVYASCLEEVNKDETTLIKGIWRQYEQCAKAEAPSTLQTSQDETVWLLQNLREQCELLEIVLLYYKDYIHFTPELLKTAKLFQALGFGHSQHSRVGVVPSAESLINHLGHLCSLILVEAIDLDWISSNQDAPDQLSEHHLLDMEVISSFKELDSLVSDWGDNPCHAPILLAWTMFKFVALPKTDIEHTRLVGNRALQADVFSYLLCLLESPYICGNRPVASLCKGVVHTLLSLVITSFNEESLGDPMTLVSIAAKTLTHPRLRLEFWEKGANSGMGLLLSSSLTRFPLELTSTLTLLNPLTADPLSTHYLFQHLSNVPYFTEPFSPRALGACVDLGEEEGTWVLTRPRTLYAEEGRMSGCHGITLPVGTRGVVTTVGETQAVCWEFSYSAWELFCLETNSILHCPGIGVDSSPLPIIMRVTEITRLVTQMLKNDWSLASHLQPITSQYFFIIQKFSSLPNPPSHLIAACLECIAVMAANTTTIDVWRQLGQTGFLPFLRSPPSQVEHVAVAPGHYGQLLNVWERPRGIYPVSMAMLELLLTMTTSSDTLATTDDQLACVVFVMREMFAGYHKWRYRSVTQREEIGLKLLQLCHRVVKATEESLCDVRLFVSHFLLHTVGGQAILNTLSVGVDTINRIYSSSHSTSHPVLLVESLKLTFSIIDLLLQNKTDQIPTPLEQALATQSSKRSSDGSSPVHLVAVIASYIHHHDDPHLPAGATRLLTRLSQVAPMSVFACLGSDAVSIRDAYVSRLGASVEDTELKVAILELISESVISQPGLMELFLCVKTSGEKTSETEKKDEETKEEVSYVLELESCLHPVLDMIEPDKQPPTSSYLLHAAMSLLRLLWQGRHDAALVALRSQPDFWKHLTNPLFNELQLSEVEEANIEDASYELRACSQVMHIVAMETYYVVRNRMDKDLISVMAEFSSSRRYTTWTECLNSLSVKEDVTSDSSPPSLVSPQLVEAQYHLVQAWRTLLLVAASYQESVFQLSDSSMRTAILSDLLQALESQLTDSPTNGMVAIATELSMLYMILLKKWASNVKLSGAAVGQFVHILHLAGRLDPSQSAQLHTHLYSTMILLLKTLRSNKGSLELRFVSGLVTSMAETLHNHHVYLQMDSKNRPDTVAVYLLKEVVHTLPDNTVWLQTLRQYSIITIVTRTLDEHLRLKSDEEFIEGILIFFLSLARYTDGAESLLVNGVNNPLCISMADAMATKLKPRVWEKQHNGAGVLKLRAQTPQIWHRIWHLTLKLSTTLLSSLGHQCVPHSLDFTAVYQERMNKALDIFEATCDLQSLEETRSVCHFIQHLARYKQQWKFSLLSFHNMIIERIVYLASSTVAILSKRATLKHIVKTMHTSGVLPPEYGPAILVGWGRLQSLSGSASLSEVDGAWVTASPAFAELQDSLVSILTSCLVTLKYYTPSIEEIITEGVPDLLEYPLLFSLSLAPPTVDCTTPPSFTTLTSCLSTGLALMNKLDPHRVGTPSKSPSRSPGQQRTPLASSQRKRAEYLCLLEHAVMVLLSQALCYLANPSTDTHDKQVLKKELANELGSFSQGLLLNFTRKGAPSPGSSMRTPTSHSVLHDSSSGKTSSLSFSDTAEQGIFLLADSFAKQFFR